MYTDLFLWIEEKSQTDKATFTIQILSKLTPMSLMAGH